MSCIYHNIYIECLIKKYVGTYETEASIEISFKLVQKYYSHFTKCACFSKNAYISFILVMF